MMYSAFTTEDKLLDKLKERFMVPDRIEAGNKLKIQVRVCIFIKHWVEKDPYLTDDAKNKILTFLQESVTEQSFEIMVKAITGRILHPKSRDDDFQLLPGSHSSAKPPTPILPRNIVSTAITLHDLDELEIARQLTLLTFSIYKKIEVSFPFFHFPIFFFFFPIFFFFEIQVCCEKNINCLVVFLIA